MPIKDFLGDWTITFGGNTYKRVICGGGGGSPIVANNVWWYNEVPVQQGNGPSAVYAGWVDSTANYIRINPDDIPGFDVTANLSTDGNSIIATDGTTIGTRTSFTSNLSKKVYGFKFDGNSVFNDGVQIVMFFPDDNYAVWSVTDPSGVAVSGIGGVFSMSGQGNGFYGFAFTLPNQIGNFPAGQYTFRFHFPPGQPDKCIGKVTYPKKKRDDEIDFTATAKSGG